MARDTVELEAKEGDLTKETMAGSKAEGISQGKGPLTHGEGRGWEGNNESTMSVLHVQYIFRRSVLQETACVY